MRRRRRPAPPEEPSPPGAPPGAPESRLLVVAQVVRPHGLAGALRCRVLSEHPERFATLRRVYAGDPLRLYRVRHARLEGGERAGTVLIALAGIDTTEQAEVLRGSYLWVREADAVPLGPGEYYAHQIVGLEVVTTAGEPLGRVREILSTGANDVYIVEGPRGEILLPAIAAVVKEIDVAAGRMRVELLEGLLP